MNPPSEIKPSGLERRPMPLVDEVREIIDAGVRTAFANANQIAVLTYWKVGKRIVEELKRGENRADYGKRIVGELARALSPHYGGHYSKRNLDYFCQFYRNSPTSRL